MPSSINAESKEECFAEFKEEKTLERRQSFDHVRNLVQREGKEARNLVSWQIPADQPLNIDTSSVVASENKKHLNYTSSGRRATKFVSPRSNIRAAEAAKIRRCDSDFRALHWGHLFETLRRTVDAIYDICQFDESVIECKEAIMILENYTKDFVALIEFLNAEAVWEKSDKPTSIAWEIRKTVGSPNKVYSKSNVNPVNENSSAVRKLVLSDDNKGQQLFSRNNTLSLEDNNCDSGLETPPDSSSPVGNVSPTILSVDNNTGLVEKFAAEQKQRSVDKIDSDENSAANNEQTDDGWKLVSYSRRNSKEKQKDNSNIIEQGPSPKLHVRTPPALDEVQRRRFRIFPKNAQEIRQTKASLAKMEHNRQYLAEQRQKEVDESLKLLRCYSQTQSSKVRRLRFVANNVSYSLPSLNEIGINFADPAAVKRIAAAAKANLRSWKFVSGGGRKNRFRSYQSAESLCSLESIKEDDSEIVEHVVVAQDVKNEETREDVKKDSADSALFDTNGQEKALTLHVAGGSVPFGYENQKVFVESKKDEDSERNVVEVSEIFKDEEIERHIVDEDDDEAWQHMTAEEESLAQEEESLQKEIEEERRSIDIEISRAVDLADESDEDADDETSKKNNAGSTPHCELNLDLPVESTPMTWEEVVGRWKQCTPISWAEIMEIELSEVRPPGQAVQMHEKLSSPSRKRNNADDTIKKHEERQAKADELRQGLLNERQSKLSKLFNRVDEVRAEKFRLLERKRKFMESRLARAAENRSSQLQMKVRKAHDEEEKVHEIAFINSLEADNKRHGMFSRHQDHEMRLQNIHEERQRKVEEKAARELAVEERRKAAEEERQTRLRELAERTKRRQERIDLNRTEQEHHRQQLAKEKAREREERLAGRRAARQATTDELLQRIQQKQEESLRRHEENLGLIKQRASEMSTPRSANQSGDISNEVNLLAHLKGSRHVNAFKENSANKDLVKENLDNESSKCIIEATDDKVETLSPTLNEGDKLKFLSKRRQKIRQKFVIKTKEFLAAANSNKSFVPITTSNLKLVKVDKELEKCCSSCGFEKQWLPPDVHSLERSLNEINRTLSSSTNRTLDQEAFYNMKSWEYLMKMLSLFEKPANNNSSIQTFILPMKSLINVSNVLKTSLQANGRLSLKLLYSGQILTFVDCLSNQLSFLINHKKAVIQNTSSPSRENVDNENVCLSLLALLNEILSAHTNSSISTKNLIDTYIGGVDGFQIRSLLLISYVVAYRCIENVGEFLKCASERPLNDSQTNFIVESLTLVKLLLKDMHISSRKGKDNSTQLLDALKTNELCYSLTFLYSTLLNPSNSTNVDQSAPLVQLTENQSKTLCAVLDLINLLGVVDLKCLQEILGQEGTSLEFRHIASYLMSYSRRYDCPSVLHRIVVSIGFFTSFNAFNQDLVHSGSQPSILQQLCVLPFSYFSDPSRTKILFPTLIACCYRNESNRQLLEEELSGKLLSTFIEDKLESDESNDETLDDAEADHFIKFSYRFLAKEFESARDYFSTVEMELG